MPTDTNPYAAPSTTSDVPIRRASTWVRLLCLLQCVIVVIALGAEVYHIETILGSGPVFGIAGICLAGFAYRHRDTHMAMFGVSAVAFVLFIFLLINVMEWGPSEADLPVQALSFVYACVALPTGLWLLMLRPQERDVGLAEQSHPLKDRIRKMQSVDHRRP